MDVSMLSSSLSQLSIRHAVAIQTQKIAMDGAKTEGETVIKMLDNLVRISDSRVGTGVNVLA